MSSYLPTVFQDKNTTLKEQFTQEQSQDTKENIRVCILIYLIYIHSSIHSVVLIIF